MPVTTRVIYWPGRVLEESTEGKGCAALNKQQIVILNESFF